MDMSYTNINNLNRIAQNSIPKSIGTEYGKALIRVRQLISQNKISEAIRVCEEALGLKIRQGKYDNPAKVLKDIIERNNKDKAREDLVLELAALLIRQYEGRWTISIAKADQIIKEVLEPTFSRLSEEDRLPFELRLISIKLAREIAVFSTPNQAKVKEIEQLINRGVEIVKTGFPEVEQIINGSAPKHNLRIYSALLKPLAIDFLARVAKISELLAREAQDRSVYQSSSLERAKRLARFVQTQNADYRDFMEPVYRARIPSWFTVSPLNLRFSVNDYWVATEYFYSYREIGKPELIVVEGNKDIQHRQAIETDFYTDIKMRLFGKTKFGSLEAQFRPGLVVEHRKTTQEVNKKIRKDDQIVPDNQENGIYIDKRTIYKPYLQVSLPWSMSIANSGLDVSVMPRWYLQVYPERLPPQFYYTDPVDKTRNFRIALSPRQALVYNFRQQYDINLTYNPPRMKAFSFGLGIAPYHQYQTMLGIRTTTIEEGEEIKNRYQAIKIGVPTLGLPMDLSANFRHRYFYAGVSFRNESQWSKTPDINAGKHKDTFENVSTLNSRAGVVIPLSSSRELQIGLEYNQKLPQGYEFAGVLNLYSGEIGNINLRASMQEQQVRTISVGNATTRVYQERPNFGLNFSWQIPLDRERRTNNVKPKSSESE